MVTEDRWQHAEKVYKQFQCKNLGDYHSLYLLTDTLLLACVVEEFRSLCYRPMAWTVHTILLAPTYLTMLS